MGRAVLQRHRPDVDAGGVLLAVIDGVFARHRNPAIGLGKPILDGRGVFQLDAARDHRRRIVACFQALQGKRAMIQGLDKPDLLRRGPRHALGGCQRQSVPPRR
ncbi:hypothetical protein D3C72_1721800 [compost metagenome]